MDSRELQRPLDRIVVRAESPDRTIGVTMRGRGGVELLFDPGAYRRYEEQALGRQLSQLATSTWVAYRRACFAALSEEIGETVRGNERSPSPRMRALYRDTGYSLDVDRARGGARHDQCRTDRDRDGGHGHEHQQACDTQASRDRPAVPAAAQATPTSAGSTPRRAAARASCRAGTLNARQA